NENVWLKNNYSGQINYAISNRNEISISFTSINSKYLTDSINIFNGRTYNLNYRIYEKNKGSIAPIGKYVNFGLLYHRALYHRTDTLNKVQTIGVSAGIGIQRAITKRIIYNIQYQVWLPGYTHYKVDPNAYIKAATPKDYISELSKSSIVSLQFKLGFLIF
ncbi:MAG: hypothetical protein HYZ42_14530, partial [Bacteroidetes bacterium]|nr:hypothetical protein [Bacteroidota bacterium]